MGCSEPPKLRYFAKVRTSEYPDLNLVDRVTSANSKDRKHLLGMKKAASSIPAYLTAKFTKVYARILSKQSASNTSEKKV